MLWLYILLQFLFYGVIAYVFYRFVYKAALANRKAALTEKPEDDDYVPEVVDMAFINRVGGTADTRLRTKRERDFAAILENWNPAEFKPVEPGAYDGDVAPILAIFETKPTNKDRTQDLRQYLRLTHKVEPKNLDGMHIYLRNWVTLNK